MILENTCYSLIRIGFSIFLITILYHTLLINLTNSMKKFFTLFACALCALVANAQTLTLGGSSRLSIVAQRKRSKATRVI